MKTILNKLIVVLGLSLVLSACHKKEIVNISKALVQTANGITSDTLKGTIKGTLLSGKTYYFKCDIGVDEPDTSLLQNGVHLMCCGDGITVESIPDLFVNSPFVVLQTATKPNYITVKNADD